MHGVHELDLPRRYLPSLSLLAAFEAVVRTGSTAAAARELHLTQGTVSRLVQGLEAQVGAALFLRERKRLVPTAAALTYAAEVRRALDMIGHASLKLSASPGGGTLSLAMLPTFGTHWLAPRLPDFLHRHPGVTINLGTRLRPFDFGAEGFDAAIHFGEPVWPHAGHCKLFDERIVAVCTPAFLAAHPVRAVQDLLALPLLHLETRPWAWASWFAALGLAGAAPRGMIFDQFATMQAAAAGGMGVALLPVFLADPALAAGTLVPVLGGPLTCGGAYWLVWPEGRLAPPLPAFRDWLVAACAVFG